MKKVVSVLSLLLLSTPLLYASDQLVPAGSMVSCRVAEGKISSQTTASGDPVLCTLDPVERYGRSVLPYGSYLEGRFEDYKDPGHFVGKGWMELKFDRMFIGNRVIPVSAKVVSVPRVQRGSGRQNPGQRSSGKRHNRVAHSGAFWPIDLDQPAPPRSTPYVLKPETMLTLAG